MGYRPKISQAEAEKYARLAAALNQARPSHVWTPSPNNRDGSKKPGCKKCPGGSPFHQDRASHLFIIEEAP